MKPFTFISAGMAAAAGVLLWLALPFGAGPVPIREYLLQHAVRETGAINLVTSIYLGYRVFDTLGETIVLFLAVTGVVLYVAKRS